MPAARVLALLEILQAGGTHTAGDLAGRLGVDERTARRYVQHLLDLEIPVRSVRGRYGGFRLSPGYRMPPLMLTDDKALAVLLGLTGAPPSSPAAAESAAAKVRRVLPRRLAARLDAFLRTVTPAVRRGSGTGFLLLIAEAAREGRALAISYRAADGRRSERSLLPYAVAAHAGRWYVTGADAGSGQERTFRLDRILSASLLPETFEPAGHGDPAVRVRTALAEAPRRHAVSVLVDATREHVERRVPRGLATLEEVPPQLRLRLRVDDLAWVPSLLAWIDRPFVIEEPAALREEVRALADRLKTWATG